MQCKLRQTDPTKIHKSPLKDIVNYTKNTEKGVSSMCRELEEMRIETAEKAEKKAREEERFTIIRSVMKSLNVTAEKAMDVIGIDPSQRAHYLAML